MTKAYVALGTNLGDREANLRNALRLLDEVGVRIEKCSCVYETEPLDYRDQPWFLNAVAKAETELSAWEVLHKLLEIERRMGSQKPFPKGPRLIDLDLLLFGDETILTDELQLPHPGMLQRKFVLVPLVEIAPDLRHPTWPATAREMLAKTDDSSEVRKYGPL